MTGERGKKRLECSSPMGHCVPSLTGMALLTFFMLGPFFGLSSVDDYQAVLSQVIDCECLISSMLLRKVTAETRRHRSRLHSHNSLWRKTKDLWPKRPLTWHYQTKLNATTLDWTKLNFDIIMHEMAWDFEGEIIIWSWDHEKKSRYNFA